MIPAICRRMGGGGGGVDHEEECADFKHPPRWANPVCESLFIFLGLY